MLVKIGQAKKTGSRQQSVTSKPDVSSDVSTAQNRTVPLDARSSAFTRVPADGTSDRNRRSAAPPAVKKAISSPELRHKAASRDTRATKSRGAGSGASSLTQSSTAGATAANDSRVSSRDGADDDKARSLVDTPTTPTNRSRLPERLRQTNVQPSASKIPTPRRQRSSDDISRKRMSDQRKENVDRHSRQRSRSQDKPITRASYTTSASDRRKVAPHQHGGGGDEHRKPTKQQSGDIGTFTSQPPSTPKHLVLRERNNHHLAW